MDTLVAALIIVALGYLVFRMGGWERRRANKDAEKIICPHCKARGSVTVTIVRAGGISAAATQGLISGGFSLLAAGSHDVRSAAVTCSSCGAHWEVRA